MERHVRHTIIAAAFVAASGPAFAHAFLDSALPRVGSTIVAPPAEVVLTFTQGVEPDFSRIEVEDASGARVDDGAPHTAAGDPAKFAVPLKKLSAGTYTVIWHVTSVDTHKTQGKFKFTIAQ
jgi:methionine-rich copper-binding protein CopC